MSFSGNERNKLYYSLGGKRFVDLSYLSGLDSPADGRVVALSDLNHDGSEEIIVVNRNAPLLQVFSTTRPAANFIGVRVTGDPENSNVEAIGARVSVVCDERTIVRHVNGGTGFATRNSPVLTIGLGSCEQPSELVVDWPSGRQRVFTKLANRAFIEVPESGPMKGSMDYYGSSAGAPAGPTARARSSFAEALSYQPTTDLLYVTFWASWCTSCKKAQPRVDALARRFADRIEFVGLSLETEDTPEVVAEYQAAHTPAYTLLRLRAEAHQRAIAEASALFGDAVPAMPAAAVVDTRTGMLVWKSLGVATVSDLEQLLAALPGIPRKTKPPKWPVLLGLLAFVAWVSGVIALERSAGD